MISHDTKRPISLVKLAHSLVKDKVKSGDIVIDATVGNGHDTRFLLELVGPEGQVFGFDIQQVAIESALAIDFTYSKPSRQPLLRCPTNLHPCRDPKGEGWVRGNKNRKKGSNITPHPNLLPVRERATAPNPLTLIKASHADMGKFIPTNYHGKISAVMFNLGYLPGGDKRVITQTDSTLAALASASQLLSANGIVTVLAYPGHEGGEIETDQVKNWCLALDPKRYRVKLFTGHADKTSAPKLFAITKIP